MTSSQNYNQSAFQSPNNPTQQSGATNPTTSMPPTSGQRVPAPTVQTNAPNIPGGDGGDSNIGDLLKDAISDLASDLKKVGKGFIDSLKEYSKDVKETSKDLKTSSSATPGASAPDTAGHYRDANGRLRDAQTGRFVAAPGSSAGSSSSLFGGGFYRGELAASPAKVMGSVGRGIRSQGMAVGRRLLGAPGADLQGFLSLAPGFARGAEGFGVAEGLARQAAAGELDAMQASMLFAGSDFGGYGGEQVGIRSALGGGTLLEEFSNIGMSRSAAANMLKGIASSAGATAIGNRIGGLSQREIVDGLAMGYDIPGYFSNIGGFQDQLGEDARGNFALEFNRDIGVRGAQRTARQAQRQSGFMSLYTQNIGADRLSYNQLIDAMGGGSLSRGQAIFQRGAGAAASATSGLTADFSGVGASMLQADAMRRAGGDRLKALELLEADQAKGGSALYGRLRGMGMNDRTARLTLAGMGLSTRDIQTLTTSGEALEEEVFPSDLESPTLATQNIDGDNVARGGMQRMLPMSRMIADNENKRVNLGLANRRAAQTKLNADLRISQILISRSSALNKGLNTLIGTVEKTVKTIDRLNNATRDEFVESMKAVQDPRTDTLDRVYHYSKMAAITLLNQKVGL